jgi:hypothetical protein
MYGARRSDSSMLMSSHEFSCNGIISGIKQ